MSGYDGKRSPVEASIGRHNDLQSCASAMNSNDCIMGDDADSTQHMDTNDMQNNGDTASEFGENALGESSRAQMIRI